MANLEISQKEKAPENLNYFKEELQSLKKESKEIEKKSLEFEEKTFRINSEGWKETQITINNENEANNSPTKKINVKINATGDVIEYLEGAEKGEQIFFNYNVFIKEVCKAKNCTKEIAEKKYLMNVYEFVTKMKKINPQNTNNDKIYDEKTRGPSVGIRDSLDNTIGDIGSRSGFWLAYGGSVHFYENGGWLCCNINDRLGASGRLLKND